MFRPERLELDRVGAAFMGLPYHLCREIEVALVVGANFSDDPGAFESTKIHDTPPYP